VERHSGSSRLAAALIVVAGLAACGGGNTNPTPQPSATPTPAPTPVPTPTPNPFQTACGLPLPNPQDLNGFKVKVQLEPNNNKKVLNASPLVANQQYCQSLGMTGDFCTTRNEEDPTRTSCDHYVSGTSSTGRPGPDWFQEVNGQDLPCGEGDVPGTKAGTAPQCTLLASNQYLVNVFATGRFKACGGTGSNRSCGICVLTKFGPPSGNPAGLCKQG
jgi:hypothetical protein